MTKLKRLVAVALTFLMILSSVSVAAMAAGNGAVGTNLTISTKIQRMINGEWTDTDKVVPGEKVKAQVYVGTDYYTNNGTLLFFYNKNFFEDASKAGLQTLAVNSNYPVDLAGTYYSSENDIDVIGDLEISNKFTGLADINDKLASSDLGFFVATYTFGEKGDADNAILTANTWLCEFELTVKSDITDADAKGNFFALPETAMSTDYTYGYIDVPKGNAGEKSTQTVDMANWDATLNFAAENMAEVSLYTNYVEVTLDAGAGKFANGNNEAIYGLEAGDAFNPEIPTRVGYELLGWVPAGSPEGTTPTALPTTVPDGNASYVAVWDTTTDLNNTLGFRTEFFRETEPDKWEWTEKVVPGETIKARIYVDIDYYTTSLDLIVFYEDDFFKANETAHPLNVAKNAVINPNAVITPAGSYGGQVTSIPDTNRPIGSTSSYKGLIERGYLAPDFMDSNSAFLVNLQFDDCYERAHNIKDTGDDAWLVELTLDVLPTASAAETDMEARGQFYFVESTIKSYDRQRSYINVPVGDETNTQDNVTSLDLVNIKYVFDNTSAYTESTVTFDPNGGAFADGSIAPIVITGDIGTAINAADVPADPTMGGYKFEGWIPSDAPTVTDAEGKTVDNVLSRDEVLAQYPEIVYDDLTFTAKWKQNVVITFDTDGGTEIPAIEDAVPGEEFAEIADPTKDGYTFIGWDKKGGELPETYPEADTTYVAQWALNVKVSFDTDGGTDIAPAEGYAGQEFPADTIADPEKEGYYFAGWFEYDPEDIPDGVEFKPVELPEVFPEADKTYYAVFEKSVYDVYYYVLDPEQMNYVDAGVMPHKFGDVINKTPAGYTYEVPEGYTLSAAYTDFRRTTLLEDGATMPARDVELFYVITPVKSDVIFDANGGKFEDGSTIVEYKDSTFGTPIIVPEDPTMEGNEFLGWAPVVDENVPAEDVIYEATWNTLSYDATYKAEGQEDQVFEDILFEGELEYPADPDVFGKEFVKWVDQDGKTPADYEESGMPAKDLVFTAEFKNKTFNVTFNLDGGNINGDTADVVKPTEFGATIVAPAQPEKDGNKFLGWTDDGGKTVLPADKLGTLDEGDKTFTAVWEANPDREYVINIFEEDAQTGEYPADPTTSITMNNGVAGKEIPYKDITIPTGFVLDETMSTPKEDMVIPVDPDQVLVINIYLEREVKTLVVYEVYDDGETADTAEINKEYRYEQSIEKVADPTRDGYTFIGWDDMSTDEEETDYEIPATMPNNDITVKGVWEINTYDVTFDAGDGAFPDGDKTKPGEADYNESIDKPEEDPTLDGYDFIGWIEEGTVDDPATDDVDESKVPVTFPDTMGTEDKVYVPIWVPSKVTLTFYDYQDSAKGPEVDKTTYPYGTPAEITVGDAIVFPASPDADDAPEYAQDKSWLEKGYYTFEGWADAEGNVYKEGDVMPDHDLELYAVYKRVIVKLVPVDENSTAMIERDGVIESYNEGYEVILDEYGYAQPAASYEEWFVYGLHEDMEADVNPDEADIYDYVKVQGDGKMVLTYSENSTNFLGTGATIDVYDNVTGELVESFYIVIIGDLDGDGHIGSNDIGIMNSEVAVGTNWSSKEDPDYTSYRRKAADIRSFDNQIDVVDYGILVGHVNTTGDEIDQAFGIPQG